MNNNLSFTDGLSPSVLESVFQERKEWFFCKLLFLMHVQCNVIVSIFTLPGQFIHSAGYSYYLGANQIHDTIANHCGIKLKWSFMWSVLKSRQVYMKFVFLCSYFYFPCYHRLKMILAEDINFSMARKHIFLCGFSIISDLDSLMMFGILLLFTVLTCKI